MTTITTKPPATAVTPAGTCRYPGCANPARAKDDGTPGRQPGYCGQETAEDRGDGTTALIRHTAMTAFRRRAQLSGHPDVPALPVTAAVSRAAAIRGDVLAATTRLAGQLTAALDQLAALTEQLAAAADPEAAQAQAEHVRAEATARIEQARADAASHASARHAAEADAAEARAAAAEAITMTEAATTAREHAEARARDASQALHDQAAAAGASLSAARAERDAALAAAAEARADAARQREHDQHQHAAALATTTAQLTAAGDTITALRDQLTRAETALDRERAQQHQAVSLLHDLITTHPATAPGGTPQPSENPAPAGTSSKPASRRSPAPQR